MRFVHFTPAVNLESILAEGIRPTEFKDRKSPVVFADPSFEDAAARYNGWLSVLTRPEEANEEYGYEAYDPPDEWEAIVFHLQPTEQVYVGQWGWPQLPVAETTLRVQSTTADESALGGVEFATARVAELETLAASASAYLSAHLNGRVATYYDFAVGCPEIQDRSLDEWTALRKEMGDHFWPGSGHEIRIPRRIRPAEILGRRPVTRSSVGVAWFKADDFSTRRSRSE